MHSIFSCLYSGSSSWWETKLDSVCIFQTTNLTFFFFFQYKDIYNFPLAAFEKVVEDEELEEESEEEKEEGEELLEEEEEEEMDDAEFELQEEVSIVWL